MQMAEPISYRPAPASPPRRSGNRPALPPIVTRATPPRSAVHAREPSLDQFVFPLAHATSSTSSSASTSRSSSVDAEADSPSSASSRTPRRDASSLGRRRSSGASSAETGLEMSPWLTPRMERAKKTIIVPGITLTPPHSPTTVLPILECHAMDNPFIGGGAKRPWGLAPKRPSFLRTVTSLLPLSPTKAGPRRSTVGLFEEDGTDSEEEDLRKPPRRAFSMPSPINNAIEWAKSASSSATASPASSPVDQYFPQAVVEKMSQQAEGFSLPPIPTSSSALFSPPPVSAPTFFASNNTFPSRKETSSPPISSRRRGQSRAPLFILIFPLFVIALHIYLSFADARFMYSGRSLVFGTPHDHRHSLALGVKLDMKEAWSKFEEKLAAKGAQAEEAGIERWKRFFADDQDFSAEGNAGSDEVNQDQEDVLAFLQEMQEAAYIGVEL